MGARVGVHEPLKDRHADCAVESSGTEPKALPDILEEEVALDFALERDFQHAGGDVDTAPEMPVLIEDLARQATSAPNVKEEAALVLGKLQKLQRAVRHLRLDVLHAGAAG
jgi:hypothetical protein